MPGPITALLCNALPITGANGGLQINEMLVVSVVSVSMRKMALKSTWKSKAPRVATVVNINIPGSTSDRVFKLTWEATAMLKIRIKKVPASNVRLMLRMRGCSEARTDSRLILNIKMD